MREIGEWKGENQMSRVVAIQTGSTLVSPAVLNKSSRKNPFAYTGMLQSRKNRVEVPVKCFLLEVADHKVLIDTGWGVKDANHALKHLGFGLWFASEPVLTPDMTVLPQLKKFGVSINDIETLAMTHLDCDHVGGLDAFVGKKDVWVSQDELNYANQDKLRYKAKLWEGTHFKTLVFKEDINAPFGLTADLFGDNTVIAYLVPGHSKGSVIYVGCEGERYFLIVGDTGYTQQSWTELKLPGIIYNKDNLLIGLEWVRSKLTDKNCARVFAAHDPAVAQGEYDILGRVQDIEGILR